MPQVNKEQDGKLSPKRRLKACEMLPPILPFPHSTPPNQSPPTCSISTIQNINAQAQSLHLSLSPQSTERLREVPGPNGRLRQSKELRGELANFQCSFCKSAPRTNKKSFEIDVHTHNENQRLCLALPTRNGSCPSHPHIPKREIILQPERQGPNKRGRFLKNKARKCEDPMCVFTFFGLDFCPENGLDF